MKLYYHPNSQPSRTTLAVAKHLGLEVETEVVDLLKGGQRAPEYLAVNPNGKVPALADGDLKLWESSAIQLYLCRQASGQTLWPEDAAAQADVARWQAWAGTTWNRPLGLLTWNLLFVSKVMGKDPDEQQVAEGRTLFAAAAPILEAHLDGREWIVGEALTLADFACASMLTYHHLIGVPMDEYPNIAAWYGRVEALDCWQATVPPSPGGQG